MGSGAIDNTQDMFYFSRALVGGNGTTVNFGAWGGWYAIVDGLKNRQGYFTAKN